MPSSVSAAPRTNTLHEAADAEHLLLGHDLEVQVWNDNAPAPDTLIGEGALAVDALVHDGGAWCRLARAVVVERAADVCAAVVVVW